MISFNTHTLYSRHNLPLSATMKISKPSFFAQSVWLGNLVLSWHYVQMINSQFQAFAFKHKILWWGNLKNHILDFNHMFISCQHTHDEGEFIILRALNFKLFSILYNLLHKNKIAFHFRFLSHLHISNLIPKQFYEGYLVLLSNKIVKLCF